MLRERMDVDVAVVVVLMGIDIHPDKPCLLALTACALQSTVLYLRYKSVLSYHLYIYTFWEF